jgi:hypothetical protein
MMNENNLKGRKIARKERGPERKVNGKPWPPRRTRPIQ